jgi:hypothetical protein
MILSGGEQTINFNLTQEEEEQKSLDSLDDSRHSDDEMEIGDETVAEQPNRHNLQLPDSHI